MRELFDDFNNIKTTSIFNAIKSLKGIRFESNSAERSMTFTDGDTEYHITCDSLQRIRLHRKNKHAMTGGGTDLSFKRKTPKDFHYTTADILGCENYTATLYLLFHSIAKYRKESPIFSQRMEAVLVLQDLHNFYDFETIAYNRSGIILDGFEISSLNSFRKSHNRSSVNLFKSPKDRKDPRDYSYRSKDAYDKKLLSHALSIHEMKLRGHFNNAESVSNLEALRDEINKTLEELKNKK